MIRKFVKDEKCIACGESFNPVAKNFINSHGICPYCGFSLSKSKILLQSKINAFLTLKLEGMKTNIYVAGKLFLHCKHLLIINPQESEIEDEITSIDEAKSKLSSSLENKINPIDLGITPIDEFWAHCSNIQAWTEHNYDTRLLEKTLAFGLLEKLTEAGEPQALRIFKEEVAKRLFYYKYSEDIYDFLICKGYTDLFSNEEICDLLEEGGQELLQLRKELDMDFTLNFNNDFDKPLFLIFIENGVCDTIRLRHVHFKKLPKALRSLKSLKSLEIYDNGLESLPNWIGELKNLEELIISHNLIRELPASLGNLRNLKILMASDSQLVDIPVEIGNITNLKKLYLGKNKIMKLPDIFGSLKSLEILSIVENNLSSLPKSLELNSTICKLMRGNSLD